jgi:aspartate aminotransferase
VQEAAAVAFAEGPDVAERIRVSRNLHARVCRAVASRLAGAGAVVPEPKGAFYVYPDFGPHRDTLRKRHGVTTGEGLAALLMRRYGIGVLAGSAFGEPSESLCLRVATSCLYGPAEAEQEAALAAADPLALPWVADALSWLSESLTDLVR